ncbi:hypothetical protein H311_03955 [Anncaliia algerae PRA109]|nr:hypothetical protein H311_03955 [Anncaliia algerae PRA109]
MSESVKRIKKDEALVVSSTRTLFIGKIASQEENTELRKYLQSTDDVFEIYSFNETLYNVLFVIFFDLRTSERVYEDLKEQGKFVLYTISKYEIPRNGDRCDENKNQGTLLVMGRDLNEPLQEEELLALFQTHGKIRSVRDFKPFQKYLEFYDTRDTVKAFKSIDTTKYKNGYLSLKFFWDIPINTRWEMIKEVDNALKEMPILKEESDIKKEENGEKASKIYEKNVFLKAFDDFIVENLSHIEKWF